MAQQPLVELRDELLHLQHHGTPSLVTVDQDQSNAAQPQSWAANHVRHVSGVVLTGEVPMAGHCRCSLVGAT